MLRKRRILIELEEGIVAPKVLEPSAPGDSLQPGRQRLPRLQVLQCVLIGDWELDLDAVESRSPYPGVSGARRPNLCATSCCQCRRARRQQACSKRAGRKAAGFDPAIRRFESSHPSQHDRASCCFSNSTCQHSHACVHTSRAASGSCRCGREYRGAFQHRDGSWLADCRQPTK